MILILDINNKNSKLNFFMIFRYCQFVIRLIFSQVTKVGNNRYIRKILILFIPQI